MSLCVIDSVLLYIDTSAVELAKLYGNRSAVFYQMALEAETEDAGNEDISEILQHALNDALKSVELDPAYEKGHFRLVQAQLSFLSPWGR